MVAYRLIYEFTVMIYPNPTNIMTTSLVNLFLFLLVYVTGLLLANLKQIVTIGQLPGNTSLIIESLVEQGLGELAFA